MVQSLSRVLFVHVTWLGIDNTGKSEAGDSSRGVVRDKEAVIMCSFYPQVETEDDTITEIIFLVDRRYTLALLFVSLISPLSLPSPLSLLLSLPLALTPFPFPLSLQTRLTTLRKNHSGSMSGSRMNQCKSALQLFLRSLPLSTKFNSTSDE